MARSSIMGFTEAELGFVLAAVFVALAGHEISERRVVTTSAVTVSDTLAKENKRLRATLDSLRRLSSKLTPPCTERGEANASVARLFVTSASTYVLRGDTLSVTGVRDRLKAAIDRSAQLGCRYYVDVVPAARLSAQDLIRATRPLEGTFYLRRVL
jgi:hypothetical protein